MSSKRSAIGGQVLKHLGLWELTPRPLPRMAKSQPLYTEPRMDCQGSQLPPSDSGPHHLTLMENSRYVFEAEKCLKLMKTPVNCLRTRGFETSLAILFILLARRPRGGMILPKWALFFYADSAGFLRGGFVDT